MIYDFKEDRIMNSQGIFLKSWQNWVGIGKKKGIRKRVKPFTWHLIQAVGYMPEFGDTLYQRAFGDIDANAISALHNRSFNHFEWFFRAHKTMRAIVTS